FVDRDMFVHFHGGGIGHKSMFHVTKMLENDARKYDEPLLHYDEYGEVVENCNVESKGEDMHSDNDNKDFESGDEGPQVEVDAEDERDFSELDSEDSEDTDSQHDESNSDEESTMEDN
ncbi:hypothetical protein Moror_15095, partial [Moniliophthora roreri MCA 2997]